MVAKVKIPDIPRFQRKMRDFPDDVEKNFPREMEDVLRKAADIAKGLAPRKTGRLVRSIGYGEDSDGPALVSNHDIAPYNWITERGGSHPVYGNEPMIPVTARPFLQPAAAKVKNDLGRACSRSVQKAGREAGFR